VYKKKFRINKKYIPLLKKEKPIVSMIHNGFLIKKYDHKLVQKDISFAVIIPKRKVNKAFKRNKIKRVIKTQIKNNLHIFSKGSYVIILLNLNEENSFNINKVLSKIS